MELNSIKAIDASGKGSPNSNIMIINRFYRHMRKKEISINRKQSILLAAFRRPLSGSITVETAMVLPIFLFAMLSVMYITDSIRVSSDNTEKLAEQAYKLAKYAYAGNALTEETMLADAVDVINNGEDIIDLVKRYRVEVAFDMLGAYDPYAVDRVRVRAFTGYDNLRQGQAEDREEEEMVYVTDYGTVYHRSLGCSHLNLNVRAVDGGHVSEERANDGSRYYACEYCCRHGEIPATAYLTDDGNRYHSTLSCGALKRTVREVPLSQTTLPPCKECGR
ncbi:MAG: hypothetical protein K6G42_11025 [Lachnospiraceae bacterium]|nr:hypothetical protein [Lachnospiraceae bacterium]